MHTYLSVGVAIVEVDVEDHHSGKKDLYLLRGLSFVNYTPLKLWLVNCWYLEPTRSKALQISSVFNLPAKILVVDYFHRCCVATTIIRVAQT